MQIPEMYLELIKKETEAAIIKGWDHAKTQWRVMALEVLCHFALTTRAFTVNDFRDQIKNSDIKTHDNRAMGGLMTTAKGWGWIMPTGESIPSRVGHKVHIQVWRSMIYQAGAQNNLF